VFFDIFSAFIDQGNQGVISWVEKTGIIQKIIN